MNDEARRLIETCAALLLDFDGPTTQLLPPPQNAELAEAARGPLSEAGITLPDDIATTTDHLKVLRWAGEHVPDQLGIVEAVIIRGEVEAANVSQPSDGLIELLRSHGHKAVVVTNNAPEAAQAFLARFGDVAKPVRVCGRPAGHPEVMKPLPHLVVLAAASTGVDPSHCLLIGDHASDTEAARAAGAAFLGYAPDDRHETELRNAGATALLASWSRE